MQPIDTKQAYGNYVNKKSPNSPILKNCLNAFWVGGLICSLGQLILSFCQYKGFDEKASGTIVSIILIGLSALLTSLNIFNKIGKFAGAGSLVPITGFANSIVAPSIEYNGSWRKNVYSCRSSSCIWNIYFCNNWYYCHFLFLKNGTIRDCP